MALNLSNSQVRGLYDFLGGHQKIAILQSWCVSAVRAEEAKIDYLSFKQMRREKVIPKRLGRAPGIGGELEPFSLKEDQAISQLIRDTADLKESAFRRATKDWEILRRELTPLQAERPTLLADVKKLCTG